ncbi:hypothetical protein AVEN_220395-1 [Araneus ventricosus]|uniref:Uncharacterized protein n=1 Tax=Araneus ventricosus TaxID=182803 RepID=A0A4Y2WL91_ARAVE|nr:hypothetical protein AVEN_220395-1 [Araneus ventricosus]
MRRSCNEQRDRPREVEEEEQAGRAQARGIPLEEIPLIDMHPPVEEDAPQAVADEQPEGVPEAAVHPEGIIGPQHPINPAEEGNRPLIPNPRCLAGEAETESTERQQDEACSKEMKKCVIMLMLGLLLYLTIGTVLANVLRSRTQNVTTPVTDMDFNVTTPMTTIIFNATTSVDDDLSFNATDMDI